MSRRVTRIGKIAMFLVILQMSLANGQEKAAQTYQQVKPQSGERCIVCAKELSPEDVTLIVKGRRVPLKQAMVDSFLNNQDAFFAQLQPRGALFQENTPASVARGGVSSAWFNFGLYVLAGLVFGGLCAYFAIGKGLPALPYFFTGFLANVVGLIYVLTRPAKIKDIPKGLVKVPDTHAPVDCPDCGAANHPTVSECRDCGGKLTPVYKSEISKV